MSNLSSVFHERFCKLHEVTSNYNQATLLDKLIYWWQISKYTLDDGNIWFTRSIDQISNDSQISKRSVERYLSEFEKNGLIYKVNRLFMKKHLYIRITDKLLGIICETSNINKNSPPKNEVATELQPINLTNIVQTNTFGSFSTEQISYTLEDKNPNDIVSMQDCRLFLDQIGAIDSANLAGSIYKDKDNNLVINNTVSQPSIVNNLETNLKMSKIEAYPTYKIEQQIGERLTETFKNYIKGTMRNLQIQHQLVFSNPEQLFAEIIFSVLNVENQFPGIIDNHHRINLIAKLLRQKKWRTPKGFYNHWDIGLMYKLKLEKHNIKQEHTKLQYTDKVNYNCNKSNVSPSADHYQQEAKLKQLKSKYREISLLISSEKRYLNDMEACLLKKPDAIIKQIINTTAIKITKLHEEMDTINQQIQYQQAA
jgi:hypothetical protein